MNKPNGHIVNAATTGKQVIMSRDDVANDLE